MKGTSRKIHSFIEDHFIFHIRNMHKSSIKRKKSQTCPMVKLCTYCLINKQYVEGVQNGNMHT